MPTKETEAVTILEQSAIAQVLIVIYLNQNGINRQEISHNIKAASITLDKALNYLKLSKMIKEEKQTGFPVQRIFTLTEKGLAVAAPLLQVADALQSVLKEADALKQ